MIVTAVRNQEERAKPKEIRRMSSECDWSKSINRLGEVKNLKSKCKPKKARMHSKTLIKPFFLNDKKNSEPDLKDPMEQQSKQRSKLLKMFKFSSQKTKLISQTTLTRMTR